MATRGVVLAILARDKARYLPLYLACLESQTWPKAKTHLYIRSNDNTDETAGMLQRWRARIGPQYASIHEDYSPVDHTLTQYSEHEWNAHRFDVLGAIRQESVEHARRLGCHYLVVDCDNFVQPDVAERLVELVESGFPVVAPLLVTAGDRYANLHVETDENGYFRPAPAYESIRSRALTGVIQVDVVHCTYMVGWNVQRAVSYADESGRHEYVVFSHALRKAGVPQYIDNRQDYGRLSRANTAHEFCRELRAWEGLFSCWTHPEPAGHLRALLDAHVDDNTVTYATPLGIFTVFRNEEFIAAPMKGGRAWDQELIEMLLPTLSDAEDVLDVGAHVGTHTVPCASRARHVHAFEPQPSVHALLLRNLQTNRCGNVTAYAAALGHEPRGICMSSVVPDGASAGARIHYEDRAAGVNHGGIQIDAEGVPVQMQTIDGLGLDSLRYLKVDAEGAEPLVFWGARDTIRTQRPIILYERNYKQLGADLLDRLQVPEPVRRFRIDVFTQTLGYHQPIELPGQSYLLLPARSEALAGELTGGHWTEGSFHADSGGRIWCRMPGRGDFPTGILDERTLCVWFRDVSGLFTGTLAGHQIGWSNHTAWNGI